MQATENSRAAFVTSVVGYTDDQLTTILARPFRGRPGRMMVEAVAEANLRGLDYAQRDRYQSALTGTNLAHCALVTA